MTRFLSMVLCSSKRLLVWNWPDEYGAFAAALAAENSGGSEVRRLVGLAARLSSYDYGQLIAEAQTKIRTLKTDDGLLRTSTGYCLLTPR